ncbi:MAG: hypothetical protein ACR2QO_16460, partial [Acidimicrobiales bacterium]
TCARALDILGTRTTTHRAGPRSTEWSASLCFAGLGRGEVVNDQGAKVSGVSQRRTRGAARFQVAFLRRWDPEEQASLLALDPEERARCVAEIAEVAAAIPHSPEEILDAALEALNR